MGHSCRAPRNGRFVRPMSGVSAARSRAIATTAKTAAPNLMGHDLRHAWGSGLAKGSGPKANRKRSTSEPTMVVKRAVPAATSPSVEAWDWLEISVRRIWSQIARISSIVCLPRSLKTMSKEGAMPRVRRCSTVSRSSESSSAVSAFNRAALAEWPGRAARRREAAESSTGISWMARL